MSEIRKTPCNNQVFQHIKSRLTDSLNASKREITTNSPWGEEPDEKLLKELQKLINTLNNIPDLEGFISSVKLTKAVSEVKQHIASEENREYLVVMQLLYNIENIKYYSKRRAIKDFSLAELKIVRGAKPMRLIYTLINYIYVVLLTKDYLYNYVEEHLIECKDKLEMYYLQGEEMKEGQVADIISTIKLTKGLITLTHIDLFNWEFFYKSVSVEIDQKLLSLTE